MKLKKRGFWPKLAVLGVLVWVTVSLVSLRSEIAQGQELLNQTNVDIDRQRRENALLEDAIINRDDDEHAAALARDAFGYVSSDETIFVDITN